MSATLGFSRVESLRDLLMQIATPPRGCHSNSDCFKGKPCIRIGESSEREVLGVLWHESIHHAIATLICKPNHRETFDEELYRSLHEDGEEEHAAIGYMGLFNQ